MNTKQKIFTIIYTTIILLGTMIGLSIAFNEPLVKLLWVLSIAMLVVLAVAAVVFLFAWIYGWLEK